MMDVYVPDGQQIVNFQCVLEKHQRIRQFVMGLDLVSLQIRVSAMQPVFHKVSVQLNVFQCVLEFLRMMQMLALDGEVVLDQTIVHVLDTIMEPTVSSTSIVIVTQLPTVHL